MNPAFMLNGEGWPKYPSRSFGRLDETEPVYIADADEAVFAFNVVDASWSGFSSGGACDLGNMDRPNALAASWSNWFNGKPPDFVDVYDRVPIYRIEITSQRGSLLFSDLAAVAEEDWVEIQLGESGIGEADVFGSLSTAPVTAHVQYIKPRIPQSAALNLAFDMNTWPNSSEADIKTAIGAVPNLEYLIGFDVGQGSAVGLADANEDIQLYFDLGAGVYRNHFTRPNPLRFCWRKARVVVLSHWDSDHWAGEASDPHAAKMTWIAPRQTLGPSHAAFASRIAAAGGKLLIWGASPPSLSVAAGSQTLKFSRCTGTSRNGSGIAAEVSNPHLHRQWLLTGDARYDEIPLRPTNPIGVVVPHHGADMGNGSIPPLRPRGYVRLLYSFGPGNKHGRSNVQHPTSAAMTSHEARGWQHGGWSGQSPGICRAGADVLATAIHGISHLDGMVASWSAAPVLPFSTLPCSTHRFPAGCTGAPGEA